MCSFLWKCCSLHRKTKYFICQKNLPHQPHAQPATFYMLTHLSLSHCTTKLLIFTLFFPIGRKGNEHAQSTTCRRKRGPRLTSLQPTKHRNTPKGYPILPVVVRAEVSRNPVPFWHFCREKVKLWKNLPEVRDLSLLTFKFTSIPVESIFRWHDKYLLWKSIK